MMSSKTFSAKNSPLYCQLNNFYCPNRDVEVAAGIGDLGPCTEEPFDMFDKEDMSDMFRRAMLEKMGLIGQSQLMQFFPLCLSNSVFK